MSGLTASAYVACAHPPVSVPICYIHSLIVGLLDCLTNHMFIWTLGQCDDSFMLMHCTFMY